MAKLRTKRGTLGTVMLVAVPVFAILAFWYAASAWTSLIGPPMPTTGYVALTPGVVFSLVIGIGRHGFDEPHRSEDGDWPS